MLGFEGIGAKYYFSGLGKCISNPDFEFTTRWRSPSLGRSRRPPADPVTVILSFGDRVLWNHLLSIIELQGLDPYYGCLHQSSDKHPALISDLIEEFRAPIVDSLVLMMINQHSISPSDFVFRDGGCYLNISRSKKYLKAFLTRMETEINTDDGNKQPKWDSIVHKVKTYKRFIYSPLEIYQPYQIR